MTHLEPPRGDSYRSRYLKMKSVLHDRTTGLPAVPVLIERLRTGLDSRRALGVLHVAVDNLDLVESLYGWQTLDRVLTRVAFELREARGRDLPADTMIAINAVAGDRFALFVPAREGGREVDEAYLRGLAEALRERIDACFQGGEFAALGPRLSARAGQALLARNPFYRFERRVYAALDEAASWQSAQQLRRERNRTHDLERILQGGELATVFQPVVDLRDRSVLGYEALSRGPADTPFERPLELFAACAEVGVASDLDRACRDAAMRALRGLARPGKLFLNALPDSLGEDLVQQADLLDAMEDVALAPRDLVLEFSERDAQSDPDRFVERLGRLKHRGFSLSLDDIGTGYAGRTVLERVRPDFLKLDGSLVQGIDRNRIKQELILSLIRVAAQLGASVVAEGIETEDEARTLADAGAQFGQGFFFGAPQPPERIAAPGFAPQEH